MFHQLLVHIDQITAKAAAKNNKKTTKKVETAPQSKDFSQKNEKKELSKSSHAQPPNHRIRNSKTTHQPNVSSRSNNFSQRSEKTARKSDQRIQTKKNKL